MTNAEALQIVSEVMLYEASCCYLCDRHPALYEDEHGPPHAVCYDCAPDHKPLSALGRAYGALERRFAG